MGPFEPPSVLYKNRKHTKVTVTMVLLQTAALESGAILIEGADHGSER